jgi:hypothetical protein
MPAAAAKGKSDELLQEIFNALGQWSDLERDVFVRAHYHGQSMDDIARSLGSDIKQVNAILKKCDSRLYTSLKAFRKCGCEKTSLIPPETAAIDPHCRDLKSAHGLLRKANKHLGPSQMAI